VVFIIAAVGIINTMLMSVFERVQEIGMMRALGMTDREVLWSFIFEGGAIGFFGAVMGVFIGFVLNCYQIYHGFDWSLFADMDIGYRVMNVVKGVWNPGAFIFAFLFSVIVPALISIYPSRMLDTGCRETKHRVSSIEYQVNEIHTQNGFQEYWKKQKAHYAFCYRYIHCSHDGAGYAGLYRRYHGFHV
jgi:hypothetical protein